MRSLLILSLISITPIMLAGKTRSAPSDSLFSPDQLTYFSPLERRVFADYFKGQPDHLAMLAAVDPSATENDLDVYREWLTDINREIRERRFERRSESKKIDRIRKTVNDALMDQYKIDAGFGDLFKFGQYNQVTAAAVYALVCEALDIPYEIMEEPNRVYLVAYPEEERIPLNISEEYEQYFSFNHETRNAFVDHIYETGVIDYLTYRNNTKKQLFEKYFYADQPLGLPEITGLLYLHAAVRELSLMSNVEAYAQFEKAYLLFPSHKSQFLLITQLLAFLQQKQYHDPLYLGYLIKARQLMGRGISRELLEDFLIDMVNTVLVNDEDEAGFLQIRDYLMEYLDDDTLENSLDFNYHYEMGRQYFNDARYERSLNHLEQALKLRPGHTRTVDLFTRSLALYATMVSPSIINEKLMEYDTSFASVNENELYTMVKIQTYLLLFGEAFQLKDARKGSDFMERFEALVEENPELGVEHILVGKSYSSAAVYYYGKGELEKAREVLNRGLEIAPDNVQLLLKLQAIE